MAIAMDKVGRSGGRGVGSRYAGVIADRRRRRVGLVDVLLQLGHESLFCGNAPVGLQLSRDLGQGVETRGFALRQEGEHVDVDGAQVLHTVHVLDAVHVVHVRHCLVLVLMRVRVVVVVVVVVKMVVVVVGHVLHLRLSGLPQCPFAVCLGDLGAFLEQVTREAVGSSFGELIGSRRQMGDVTEEEGRRGR